MNYDFIKLSLLIFCVACSGNQNNPSSRGYLATHIFDDGSKQFVYTVELADAAGPGNRSSGAGRPGNVAGNVQGSSSRGLSAGVTAGSASRRGGKGKKGQQSRDSLLVDSLQTELEMTGYCRDGYMELDRMTEPSQTYIKGECVEAASKKDYARFPNEK